MRSTTLLFVGHAHTRDNTGAGGARLSGWYDPPLSALGVRQAQLLAISLRSERVAALYTSNGSSVGEPSVAFPRLGPA